MTHKEGDAGLYRRIKCPNCGGNIDLIIAINWLQPRRKKASGLVGSILTYQEYRKFKELVVEEKIVFCIGKFFDSYRRWPSEQELARFIGLSQQSTSKYLSMAKIKELVISSQQEKSLNGRFKEKEFSLSEKGKNMYSQLVYEIIEVPNSTSEKETKDF